VAQIVKSVVVSPASATLDALGLTQQFSAVAQDANGNVVPGQTFAWSASPAGVVAIDPVTGLATALANGVATISATTAGVSGTAVLSVAQAVGSVVVSPATATLDALGLTQQFTAVAKDANGNVVPGQAFTWTADNPLVARVDAGGIVTAVANGSATITATAAGVAGRAALTVAQVVKSVVVSPPTATLAGLGLTQQFTAVAQDVGLCAARHRERGSERACQSARSRDRLYYGNDRRRFGDGHLVDLVSGHRRGWAGAHPVAPAQRRPVRRSLRSARLRC